MEIHEVGLGLLWLYQLYDRMREAYSREGDKEAKAGETLRIFEDDSYLSGFKSTIPPSNLLWATIIPGHIIHFFLNVILSAIGVHILTANPKRQHVQWYLITIIIERFKMCITHN